MLRKVATALVELARASSELFDLTTTDNKKDRGSHCMGAAATTAPAPHQAAHGCSVALRRLLDEIEVVAHLHELLAYDLKRGLRVSSPLSISGCTYRYRNATIEENA